MQFNLQYLHRKDTHPYVGLRPIQNVDTKGGFAELIFLPPRPDGAWAIAALYNRVESDDDAADYESAALSVSHLLARNFRLLGEVTRDLQGNRWRLTAGVVTAF